MEYILSYDLGTGGIKAVLYDGTLSSPICKAFIEYPTYYPKPYWHEQKPSDWWNAVVRITRELLEKSSVPPAAIRGIALSGASCVCIPLDEHNAPLLDSVPIWSDKRATAEADEFFRTVNYDAWYESTGNGFPAPSYPLFKLAWLKKNLPEVFRKTVRVVGSKDYVNFLLTGNIATDDSYASGTGCFDLKSRTVRTDYSDAAKIPNLFANPVPSHTRIGTLTKKAAALLGLTESTAVFAGGVDNACMALGMIGDGENRAYISLGTSVWIPVNTTKPILDRATKPYTFAHIAENLYTSAYSIFSGGNSLRWLKETLFPELSYAELDTLAAQSPVGANGVTFHPGLAGGTMQDKSTFLRGGFWGLQFATSRNDLIRATLEGIALNLKISLDLLKKQVPVSSPIVIGGGGSKSEFWLQTIADVFDMQLTKNHADQEAAALGAAAIAARGLGWYSDYRFLDGIRQTQLQITPQPEHAAVYKKRAELFRLVAENAADYGDAVHRILSNEEQEYLL